LNYGEKNRKKKGLRKTFNLRTSEKPKFKKRHKKRNLCVQKKPLDTKRYGGGVEFRLFKKVGKKKKTWGN